MDGCVFYATNLGNINRTFRQVLEIVVLTLIFDFRF